ncbi:MFS transporter [Pseudomonas vanderleydeniana]|uniref:MFS transporter n=1 Tax=Pseudomonas vanderleydeniana TaxID=2745495 RepID=A0A9E6PQ95_9PSED|nr:MFS transporter [Pseudomonas vanderleydeniana]QXI30924.1 MFS transporter [Pseudomonas vanderleydeniana]
MSNLRSTDVRPTPGLRHFQTVTLILLVVAGLLNNLDRSALSIANPLVSHDLQITPSQMGLLLSAFSLVYALSQLPVGLALDRLGARLVLGCGLIVWSLAQAFCGLANSFSQMLIGRAVLGVGEAPHYPASAKAVSEWFDKDRRGGATGVFLLAGTVAPAIAPPLLTNLMLAIGWREMFILLGATGVLVGIAWLRLYRNRDTVDVQAGMPSRRTGISLREWAGLFRHLNTWAMIFGSAGVIYTIWLYMSWLPVYLQMERKVSIVSAGWMAAVPYLLGMLGQIAAGLLLDALARRNVSLSLSRKIPICGGLVGAGVATLIAAYTPSLTVALCAISMSMFFIYFANVGTWALAGVMVESRYVATMGSLLTFGGYLGGSAAPVVTGLLVEQTASFALALAISASLAFLSALIYAFCIRL